jgi:hypothetical protein
MTRQLIAKRGEQVEKGEFELYRVEIGQMTAISQKLDESKAIVSGINSIPNLFLIGLVSAYDAFLSQLIRCLFVSRPELLPSSDRNISFKDLVEIGSIEAARERMIEKEVESIIRDSHHQQIIWLEKKISVDLRKGLNLWPEFIELCERINLLSHTDGIVSSQYLTVCKEHGVDIKDLKIGNHLKVNQKYYERAVSVIFELGIKLNQVLWRKFVPNQLTDAADELNELSYRLIVKRRYREAINFLRFGLYEMKKYGEEATRKRMVVNLANAEKLAGNKEESERILADEDWSAATDSFTLCVAAVRDDVKTVVRLMKSVVIAGHMEPSDFQDWAVFQSVRSEPEFIETFEREFGEKIIADIETPRKPDAEVEEESEAASQPESPGKTVH